MKNGFLKNIILWSFRKSVRKRILGKVGKSENPKFSGFRVLCDELNGY